MQIQIVPPLAPLAIFRILVKKNVLFVILNVATSVQARMNFNVYRVNREIIFLMENVFRNVQMGILIILRFLSAKNAIFHVLNAVGVHLIIAFSAM